uniref:Mitochondrial carrier protein n=1 Tax=Spongospora subterranea TaxID=70186 RepID=A0A0H5RB68_9EUKA|eukprot:CRZ11051.1 hypothetical protein [Spongospora subterranea]
MTLIVMQMIAHAGDADGGLRRYRLVAAPKSKIRDCTEFMAAHQHEIGGSATLAAPTTKNKPLLLSLSASAISGGLAGTCTDLVLFPLDTLKTRLQTRQVPKQAFRFYAGLTSAMVGSFPSGAVFFTVYDTCRRLSIAHFPDPFSSMASAAVANVFACGVRVPFEIVKQQMQAGMHPSSLACIKSILSGKGISGLLTGYGSTVIREIPFDALQFALWETLKLQYSRRCYDGETLTPVQSGTMGALAGGISAAVTNPLDVVKTRLMTQEGRPVYKGFRHCLTTTWKEEGMAGLTRGIYHRVTWISLGGFLFFGSYETVAQHLAWRWQ